MTNQNKALTLADLPVGTKVKIPHEWFAAIRDTSVWNFFPQHVNTKEYLLVDGHRVLSPEGCILRSPIDSRERAHVPLEYLELYHPQFQVATPQGIVTVTASSAEAIRKQVLPESPINPSHYNGREVFDQMIALYGKEAVKGFCLCNSFKYRSRAGKKANNPVEQDISKALWYEARIKELEDQKD